MTENVRVEVLSGGKATVHDLPAGSTVEDLLSMLKCHPDAYIITKGAKPIPITRRLEDGDKLKLIKVASGG